MIANGGNSVIGGSFGEDNSVKAGYHEAARKRQSFLLVFSAHNERTLEKNFSAFREAKEKYRIIDLAYTFAVRRSTFAHRCFIVATEAQVEQAPASESTVMHKVSRSNRVEIAFVFTGQGSQWSKMGFDLMQDFPVYVDTIRQLDVILSNLENPPDWTLENILRTGNKEAIEEAALAQPATTALQIALVNLMISWNIKPSAAVGHSSGEIGAAYASGYISMEEAIIIAFLRGRAASQNQNKGLMLAVGAGESEIRADIEGRFPNVTLACHNSPKSMTLSGDTNEILAIENLFKTKKVFTRLLATGGNAYHSAHMHKLGPIYEANIIQNCSHLSSSLHLLPKTVFVSSVTGNSQKSDVIEPAYWRRNLESPVLFQEAIEELLRITQPSVIIEIGPHATLRSALEQIAAFSQDAEFPYYCPTLFREKNSTANILSTAGNLWVRGYLVDLGRINCVESIGPEGIMKRESGNVIADLPRYQWQYEKPLLWESRQTREWRLRSHARHDILGSRVPGLNKSMPTWRNVIAPQHIGWLSDHRVSTPSLFARFNNDHVQLGSEIIFPAAGYLCMAIEAITQAWEVDGKPMHEIEGFVLHDIHFETALVIPEGDRGVEVMFNLQPLTLDKTSGHKASHRWLVTSVVRSGDDDVFVDHAHGLVGIAPTAGGDICTDSFILCVCITLKIDGH